HVVGEGIERSGRRVRDRRRVEDVLEVLAFVGASRPLVHGEIQLTMQIVLTHQVPAKDFSSGGIDILGGPGKVRSRQRGAELENLSASSLANPTGPIWGLEKSLEAPLDLKSVM